MDATADVMVDVDATTEAVASTIVLSGLFSYYVVVAMEMDLAFPATVVVATEAVAVIILSYGLSSYWLAVVEAVAVNRKFPSTILKKEACKIPCLFFL